MSEAMRVAKTETGHTANGETSLETVEVAEAIKALQVQLADLRKIVQAAKNSHAAQTDPIPRQ